jgi:hypothetical protein
LTISATTNTGATRSATITLQDGVTNTSADLYVSQNGVGSNSNFGVYPSYIVYQSNIANSVQLGTFTITSNLEWSISNVPTWLTLSTSSGSGNSIVNYTITSTNFNDIATIQVNSYSNSAPITFSLDQTITSTHVPSLEINSFRIYPNPTEGDIHIEGLQNAENIYILNIYGEKVYEKTEPFETLDIPTRNLSSGVYHVFVTWNGILEKQKVVVLK